MSDASSPVAATRAADAASRPGHRRFHPQLEGMRAFASLGVMTTHVAFQTSSATGSLLHRVWGRFDLWVAVFFALSGFLLWRGHAARAMGAEAAPARPARYLRHRIVRIMPAYVVLVLCVLLLLPEAAEADLPTWLANLTLTQVYVPLTLVGGLTHMWSLAVEMGFYLVLPLVWWLLAPLRGTAARWRVSVLLGIAAASLGWSYFWVAGPVALPAGVNDQTLPPAFIPWFTAGMVLAELAVRPPGRMHRLAGRRLLVGVLAVVVFGLSTTSLAGPEGLVHPSPGEFAVRTLLGALLAFLLLAPLVLGAEGRRFRILCSTPLLTLGRWSYSIFLWHLAVLSMVFPLLGIGLFAREFATVWIATAVVTIVVSAVSYALVEEPARRALLRREAARANRRRRAAHADAGSTSAEAGIAASPTSVASVVDTQAPA